MTQPGLLVLALLLLALLYVALPVALAGLASYGKRRTVRCPETKCPAEVKMSTFSALAAEFRRLPLLKVAACSEWPQRAGCAETCVGQIARA
jgi:hypothetical protein